MNKPGFFEKFAYAWITIDDGAYAITATLRRTGSIRRPPLVSTAPVWNSCNRCNCIVYHCS